MGRVFYGLLLLFVGSFFCWLSVSLGVCAFAEPSFQAHLTNFWYDLFRVFHFRFFIFFYFRFSIYVFFSRSLVLLFISSSSSSSFCSVIFPFVYYVGIPFAIGIMCVGCGCVSMTTELMRCVYWTNEFIGTTVR